MIIEAPDEIIAMTHLLVVQNPFEVRIANVIVPDRLMRDHLAAGPVGIERNQVVIDADARRAHRLLTAIPKHSIKKNIRMCPKLQI